MSYAGFSGYRYPAQTRRAGFDRLVFLQWLMIGGAVLIVARLFYLQIWMGRSYKILAENQHTLQSVLVPERGKILVRDRADGSLHPLATNRDAWLLYVEPRNLKDAGMTARELAPFASKTEADLLQTWTAKPDSAYSPVAKGLETKQAEDILSRELPGVGAVKGWARFYPESNMGGHMIGFVRTEDTGIGKGAYGIEGAYDAVLAGREGFVTAQKDAGGRRLMLEGGKIRQAVNGSDIILTIDRTIQFEVCRRLKEAVETYEADGGTVVVMNPKTGAILAMCSMPDFDPAHYGETEDIGTFNNPALFVSYEPGSVFKPVTMAIGVESGKVGPESAYTDPGVEKIDDFEIKNSDEQAHGVQTMKQVLEKSLNTGTIYVERLLGIDAFRRGVEAFGFGSVTGIELTPESKGDISSLSKKAEIYGATASFGQGITTTPIQLANAYAAIANGGSLMKPYIVESVIHPDGSRDTTNPTVIGHPISARTANVLKGMLVSVVERGHGATAAVPGYYLAGKTGTAQVASSRGDGYLEGAIISTFAGFAPADNPAFVMVVKMDRPRVGKWAEVNASPLFKKIASFILAYLDIPIERDVWAETEAESVPDLPPDVAGGAPDVAAVDTMAPSGEKASDEVKQPPDPEAATSTPAGG